MIKTLAITMIVMMMMMMTESDNDIIDDDHDHHNDDDDDDVECLQCRPGPGAELRNVTDMADISV